MLDLVIRNGIIVDGSGAPASRGDVGVKDGRIVEVGEVQDQATRTVDADGLTVSPGFIDTHSHYDAQLFWDQTLHPSPLHGVTTAIAGHCGYTLAPVPHSEREFLAALLARVEAVPKEAIDAGVDITWESFGEFLDAADQPLGLNIGFMVGHSALRRAAMGEAGSWEQADAAQIETMRRLLGEGLAAGGMGFSTARQSTHVDWDSNPTPAQRALPDEIVQLAEVCGEHPGTWMQATPGTMNSGFEQWERELFWNMSRAANRQLFWLLVHITKENPTFHEGLMEFSSAAPEHGAKLVPTAVLLEGLSVRSDFDNPFLQRGLPDPWPEILDKPHAERKAALSDPQMRKVLRAALDTPGHTQGRGYDHRWGDRMIVDAGDEHSPLIGMTVGEVAAERGTDDFDTYLDLSVEHDLKMGFMRANNAEERALEPWLQNAHHEVRRDPRPLWGAHDSGAHLDAIVGANFPTRMIHELVNTEGAFTTEEVVHRLTGDQATKLGLRDRGYVRAGNFADIAIFEPDNVHPGPIRRATDWPGGAWHLESRPEGMHHVFVEGNEVASGGDYTGNLPGRVLRSGVDTETITARPRP